MFVLMSLLPGTTMAMFVLILMLAYQHRPPKSRLVHHATKGFAMESIQVAKSKLGTTAGGLGFRLPLGCFRPDEL